MMRRRDDGEVIAAAMQRGEWERVALALLLGVAIAARSMSDASIDDLLTLLGGDDDASSDPERRATTTRGERMRRRDRDAR